MHRGGVSVGATELLAQPNPIPERPSAGRVRSLILAGSFIAAAALVMFAAIIEAPLGVRLMLHSVVLALGAAFIVRGWLQSRQERALLDRERLARTALGESEEKFRTLVANVPGAVYRCAADPAWTMAFCSDEIQEITGFPASDFIGNSRRTFASIIHEDDRSGVAANVAAALSSGLPYTLEFRVVRADGAIRWVYE